MHACVTGRCPLIKRGLLNTMRTFNMFYSRIFRGNSKSPSPVYTRAPNLVITVSADALAPVGALFIQKTIEMDISEMLNGE